MQLFCILPCVPMNADTPLRLRINGTILPGTGTTTSTSQIVMTVTLTSPEQIDAVLCNSSQVALVAPPHACGVKYLPPGKVVGALVHVEAVHSCAGKILKAGRFSGRVQPTSAASDTQDFQCIKSIVAKASEFFCLI